MVDKQTKKVICTNFDKGRKHDFQVLKDSKLEFPADVLVLADSGYQGLQKIHANTSLPSKKAKKQPLTDEQKIHNRKLARDRVLNENVIGVLKRFRIVAEKYRNRRKRFGLRFNLIAGIYNFELPK